MSESLSMQPDPPNCADAPIRAPQGVNSGGGKSTPKSRRVRELPPPPRASDRPPRIEADESQPAGWRRWRLRRQSAGWLVSFAFHFCLLLVLALIVQRSQHAGSFGGLVAYTDVPAPLESAFGPDRPDAVLVLPDLIEGGRPAADRYKLPEVAEPSEGSAAGNDSRPARFGLQPMRPTDWLLRADAGVGGALDGRGREAKAALVGQGGGSQQSERAVQRGLRWLLAHQRDDGSWNFNHHKSPCQGLCRNPGTEPSTTAATAIVLLPFLGAGYTHAEGEYRDVVRRGLYYLIKRSLVTPHGHDLQEGTMYAQGLAAIALCEAYAMTEDPALRDFAQGAIDFIVYAQDTKGGGWRYTPGEPGDITVTGWQLMGLKSGQMAGLRVPSPTIFLAKRFLTSVQYDGGAQYGYMTPAPRRTTTAIGLLMRMYTGWRRDRPALKKGVAYLSEWGPSKDDMYYNYYATQVMRHWEAPEWEKFNGVIRDYLIATQAGEGHEAGSWHFSGGRGDVGGRLYNTAMAVMTLEVYYRYMPLYRQRSVEDEF